MLTETFSLVQEGFIVESGIQRGSVYKGKNYGNEDHDSIYIEHGLYPEIGERPEYDSMIQTLTGPNFIFDLENAQVNKVWTITDKLIDDVRLKIQDNHRIDCKSFIYSLYPQEMQNNAAIGGLDPIVVAVMADHIYRIRTEENRVCDLLELATTMEELIAISKPVWPEV